MYHELGLALAVYEHFHNVMVNRRENNKIKELICYYFSITGHRIDDRLLAIKIIITVVKNCKIILM